MIDHAAKLMAALAVFTVSPAPRPTEIVLGVGEDHAQNEQIPSQPVAANPAQDLQSSPENHTDQEPT